MHLFDPSREKIGGEFACMFNPISQTFLKTILPSLYVSLKPDHVLLWGFFPTSSKGSSPRFHRLESVDEIPDFLRAWTEDPEGMAQKHFGWDPHLCLPGAKPGAKIISAADLSVDDLDI